MDAAEQRARWGLGLHLAATLSSLVLLLPWLGTVTGLHGDEAWAGVRAAEILGGARPLTGMNVYSGPFQQYLLALLFAIGGYDVALMRALSVLANLVALQLAFLGLRRAFDGLIAGLYTWILVTTPFFAIYARQASEVTALNPLVLTAVFCLLVSGKPRRAWLAGILGGAGVLNHLIFATTLPPLLVWAHPLTRRIGLAARFVGAFGAVLATRLVLASAHTETISSNITRGALASVGRRFRGWPKLLTEVLHGDVLFLRFTGTAASSLSPLLGILLLACVLVAPFLEHRYGTAEQSKRARLAALGFIALYLATVVIAPYDADRYFLLVLWMAPLFLALCLARALSLGASSGRGQLAIYFAIGLGVLDFARTARDFLWQSHVSGGALASFAFGRTHETSNHFTRTDRLYAHLLEDGARTIYGEFFIVQPLHFYDLDAPALQLRALEDLTASTQLDPQARVVVYREAEQPWVPTSTPAVVLRETWGNFAIYAAAPR